MGIVTTATDKYQTCLDACAKCLQACYECLKACMNEPDAAARKNCMSVLLECALICQQAVAYMSMDAQFAKDLCKLCANICDKCAQECAMFKDPHCQKCADVCRACATECKKMAGV